MITAKKSENAPVITPKNADSEMSATGGRTDDKNGGKSHERSRDRRKSELVNVKKKPNIKPCKNGLSDEKRT